ncbi:MAG TPA: undecaprenyldiphospho-muramoylpentapeptide beta-N-acetylglucosaminyltransferase [Burkholderiaceae bacterium]|nr:undecaprenyldiphospho-muramoylpentapeptide beta-N-acetylglucosaminyltransferase [Burkholderiaceae bacterium]
MSRTILIMAGGTGGHVMPGLAVANEMRARAWNVVWLGNPDGMEAGLVPRHGITMQPVRFGGLRGKGLKTLFTLPWNLLRACLQSGRALRAVRPAVVLGMGGYVSFPGGLMARLTGRPLVLHEQNSVAGMANRVLARIADRVLVAFPDALPDAQWTGNPVREDIASMAPPEQRFRGRTGPLRVLVVGGSLGAQPLNERLPAALALISPAQRPTVVHQSGRGHREQLAERYRQAGVAADVREFIDDMSAELAGADLVVCRAGAMTVAELAAAGVASILVPLPHAVDDHQTGNARFLSERGAAWLVPQPQASAEHLAQLLAGLDRTQLLDMAMKARAAARPDATCQVADVCESIAQNTRVPS